MRIGRHLGRSWQSLLINLLLPSSTRKPSRFVVSSRLQYTRLLSKQEISMVGVRFQMSATFPRFQVCNLIFMLFISKKKITRSLGRDIVAWLFCFFLLYNRNHNGYASCFSIYFLDSSSAKQQEFEGSLQKWRESVRSGRKKRYSIKVIHLEFYYFFFIFQMGKEVLYSLQRTKSKQDSNQVKQEFVAAI